jgi:hypothetical protein
MAAGFRHGGEYLIDELSQKKPAGKTNEGYTYALCAAQRRARGNIWLLVAGLTGPATYAAAKWVHQMPTSLDEHELGRPSRVFWNLVRAKATMAKEDKGGTYRVGEAEVVTGGVAWGDVDGD